MKHSLFFLLLGLALIVDAQKPLGQRNPGGAPFNLSGVLSDDQNETPIEYGTVSVLQATDSSFVTGGISDENGRFRIKVKPGKYILLLQFVSYQDRYVSDIQISPGNPARLGVLKMSTSSQELDAVTVQAERTQMELKLDKKVYNIGKDLSNLSSSASGILDNLPSVEVDLEGNISLRGSQNVRVLIDGKPSGLVGLSSGDALRQLQSNLIESIEVITNPSARYDAEGLSGIINIILKKEKKAGVNGSFQVNTGYPSNQGASVNMNYRSRYINWFTNIGTSFRRSPGGGSSFQEFFLQDSTFYTRRNQDRIRSGNSYNVRFGADLLINDKNTLTGSFLYRLSDGNNSVDLTYLDYDEGDILTNSILREEREVSDDTNWEYAVNYTKTFNTKDQKLTFDIQYQENSEVERSDILQTGSVLGTDIARTLQRAQNDEGETRLLVQSDFVYPISKKSTVEAGFRINNREIRNDYIVEDQLDDGSFSVLTNFTNDFRYDENIAAAYGIFANEQDRLSYQLGVRYERTSIETLLKQTEEQNNQLYNNLFPSVNLTWKLTESTSVQGSYSKRISRARFRNLNPFFSFSDARNIRTGNPNLQPEFTDSYEIGILQNFEKGTLYSALYIRDTEGDVQRISEVDEFGITYSSPQNLARSIAYGFEINASTEFNKYWSVNGNFNVFYREIIAPSSRSDLDAETFSFSTRVSNRFKISRKSNAQVNFFYRAPQKTSQGRRLSMYSLDIGYSIDVLKNNGTIAFNVRDLFNTRKYRGETFGPTFYTESEFQWRARQATLSFVYRLNQRKQRSRSSRGNSGDFEDDGGF